MVIIILLAVVVVTIVLSMCIVPDEHEYVLETFGRYSRSFGPGLHFKLPFVERVMEKVSLNGQSYEMDLKPVITQDNITVQASMLIKFTVVKPEVYAYSHQRGDDTVFHPVVTAMRNVIGSMQVAEISQSKQAIGVATCRNAYAEMEDGGVRLDDVFIQDIILPEDLQRALDVAAGKM